VKKNQPVKWEAAHDVLVDAVQRQPSARALAKGQGDQTKKTENFEGF
jgi:hypothetical protein